MSRSIARSVERRRHRTKLGEPAVPNTDNVASETTPTNAEGFPGTTAGPLQVQDWPGS